LFELCYVFEIKIQIIKNIITLLYVITQIIEIKALNGLAGS